MSCVWMGIRLTQERKWADHDKEKRHVSTVVALLFVPAVCCGFA